MRATRAFAIALFVALGSGSAAAFADAPPAAPKPPSTASVPADARLEARELAESGDAAFGAGRCDRAIGLWHRADAKFHAPTLLLRVARCQALIGRVVEGAATLETIVREKLGSDAPPPWVEAQMQAAHELPGVRERIGTIEFGIRVRGFSVQPVIEVDGTQVAAGARSIPVDPGSHAVVVRAGEGIWERRITIADGQHERVDVELAVETPKPKPRAQHTVGLALSGAGVLGLAAGAGFGIASLVTSQKLDAACGPDRKNCPPTEQPNIDQLRATSLIADLAIGSGAALLVTGGTLLYTEAPPRREAPMIRIVAGAFGAIVEGRF